MKRLHDHKIDDAKYYEKIWGVEENLRPFYDATRQRELLSKVKDGDRVLDLGCGVYGACQYAAENDHVRAEFHCCDQSHTAKEIVDSMNLPIDFKLSDCLKTPYKDKEFDVVIAGELIEHIEDPRDLVEEMARIGKKWLVISTVNTKSENAKKHGDYPEHLWEFEPEDLLEMFNEVGEAEHHLFGDYHIVSCRLR